MTKPLVKLSSGLIIAIVGFFIISYSVRIAVSISEEHVKALSLVGFMVGILLLGFGVWLSGIRIQFPPKNLN